MKNIKDYNLEELQNELINMGEKKFRAEQIFKWLYVDEVNIIPAYFSHHLWTDKNIDYREIMDVLIKQAIDGVNHGKKLVLDNEILTNLKSKDVRELK